MNSARRRRGRHVIAPPHHPVNAKKNQGGGILRLLHRDCSMRKLIAFSVFGLVLVSGGAAYAIITAKIAHACFGSCG